MPLLDAGHEARQRKNRRCSARQVQPELHLYAQYVDEKRLTTDHPPTVFSFPAGGEGDRRPDGVYAATFSDR